jgi:hypothetical protein
MGEREGREGRRGRRFESHVDYWHYKWSTRLEFPIF